MTIKEVICATTDAAECGGCEVQIRCLMNHCAADHITFSAIFM